MSTFFWLPTSWSCTRITLESYRSKLYESHFYGQKYRRARPQSGELEAGGKPSTWFPPERLVELTSHARGMKMLSDEFIIENSKFSKNLKNVIFLKFYRETAVTFNLTLIEQIDKWLYFQAGFSMNFDRKILTASLIMNEHITSKKKPRKLHKCQHFFGFQLARGAPVLLFRATGESSTSHYSPLGILLLYE